MKTILPSIFFFILLFPPGLNVNAQSGVDSLDIYDPYTKTAEIRRILESQFTLLGSNNLKREKEFTNRLEKARSDGDSLTSMKMLSALGDIYIQAGINSMALKFYSEASTVSVGINDSIQTALLKMKIGRCYYFADINDIPVEYINSGYTLLSQSKDIEIRAMALYFKAALNTSPAETKELYRQALELQKIVISKKPKDIEANENLSRYLNANGKTEEALKIAEKINNPWLTALYLNNIGYKDLHEKNFAKAYDLFRRALKIALDERLKILLRNTLNNLAEYYRSTGDWKTATRYQFLQLLVMGSIYNEKYNSLFSEYKAKFQIELSESRIKNLETERTELSDTLHNERIITFLLFLLALSTTFILVTVITSRKKINAAVKELNLRNDTLSAQKTELELLHSELSQKELNLRNAQEIAKLANWQWNRDEDKFSFSDQMPLIFGIPKDELDKNFRSSILAVVHPDDREIVGTYLHQGRNKREYHDREYRIICNSTIKWIRSKYSALTDENGDLIHIAGTVQDITYLKEEEEIRVAAATQRSFTELLIMSQEQERKRIAGELHDSFGQDLLFIKNKVKLGLRDKNIELFAGDFISEIDHSIDSLLAHTRDIAYSLIPVHLERLGLSETLNELITRASKTTNIQFILDIEAVENIFPVEKELTIYRIVQEALNNILKHSEANNASITLSRRKKFYLLEIDDDGTGFDATNPAVQRGFGLANIVNRVDLLNGKLKISTEPGKGTNIKIYIPFGDNNE